MTVTSLVDSLGDLGSQMCIRISYAYTLVHTDLDYVMQHIDDQTHILPMNQTNRSPSVIENAAHQL